MNRLRYLLVPTLLLPLGGCTLDIGTGRQPFPQPEKRAPAPAGPYGHLPQRTSFSPMSSVQLKEGCYVGDFELGRVQIQVTGAGVDKTVIHGNLVLQTQCVVTNLTVTGDVIFKGNQAKLVDSDFFGRVIDKGVQNSY